MHHRTPTSQNSSDWSKPSLLYWAAKMDLFTVLPQCRKSCMVGKEWRADLFARRFQREEKVAGHTLHLLHSLWSWFNGSPLIWEGREKTERTQGQTIYFHIAWQQGTIPMCKLTRKMCSHCYPWNPWYCWSQHLQLSSRSSPPPSFQFLLTRKAVDTLLSALGRKQQKALLIYLSHFPM